MYTILICMSLGLFSSCNQTEPDESPMQSEEAAKITGVDYTEQGNNYTFSVSIESPDTGCDQYADWWEIIRPDGTLVYRRILGHSHVNEQPFTRSGGPVNVSKDETIYIRAHMNNLGYGTEIFGGSINEGFALDSLDQGFAAELATQSPLPESCAF